MAEILAEYPHVTPTEYSEIYPSGYWRAEYFQAIHSEAKAGVMMPLNVCRAIAKQFGSSALVQLQKFYRCVPRNVLLESGKVVA